NDHPPTHHSSLSLHDALPISQYAAVKAKADEVSQISDELDAYITTLKSASIEGIEDPTDYEVMDKPDYFNNLFFTGDKYKEGGQDRKSTRLNSSHVKTSYAVF